MRASFITPPWTAPWTAIALALLSGCASSRLTQEVRVQYATVRVAEVREGKVTYSGQLPREYEDNNKSLLQRALNLIAFSKSQKDKGRRLKAIFQEAEVDVLAQAKREFLKQLRAAKLFENVVEEGSADAEFQLSVSYGVKGTGMVDVDWRPWLTLHATLTDSNGEKIGEKIWKGKAKVRPGRPGMKPLPFPDPFDTPRLIRKAYKDASTIAVDELIRHLSH